MNAHNSCHLCPECDLLVSVPVLQNQQEARCPRCHHVLFNSKPIHLQTLLALVLTGIFLYIPANLYPMLTMGVLGQYHSTSIWNGIRALWDNELQVVAVLVFFSAMFVPLARLLILLPVLMTAFSHKGRSCGKYLFRQYVRLCEWGMVEIYMLGALVAIIKLADMASIDVGIGLICYAGLMLAEIGVTLNLNEHELWNRLED